MTKCYNKKRTGNPNHTQRPNVNLDAGFNTMHKYQIPDTLKFTL